MDSEQNRSYFENPSDEENSLINLVHRYISYWKWFVLGIVLALAAAYFYIRYQAPLYEVSASILIKDDKKGAGISELSAFDDLGLLQKSNNIDNEIEILKSRSLMTLVVKELRLNVMYVLDSDPIPVEKFSDTPLYIRFPEGDSTIYDAKEEFVVKVLSKNEFTFGDKDGNTKGTLAFGKEFPTSVGKAVIFTTCYENKSFIFVN